jgi:hypothetical protein
MTSQELASGRDESRLIRKDEDRAKPEGRQKLAHGVSRGLTATCGEPPDGGERTPPALIAQRFFRPCSGAVRFPAYPHGSRRGLFSIALTGSAVYASQPVFERAAPFGGLQPRGAAGKQGLKPFSARKERHGWSRRAGMRQTAPE